VSDVADEGSSRFFRRGRRPGWRRQRRPLDGGQANQLSLVHMQPGESGTVVEVGGGRGFARRLSAMGVRPGIRVTKVGSMFMRGPVTVRVGQTQIALGFGMARRILVKLD